MSAQRRWRMGCTTAMAIVAAMGMTAQRASAQGRGSGGDRGRANSSSDRQAAIQVLVVADERSNSLVVAAPDDVMTTIEQLVEQMDVNVTDITEVQVFPLENADAVELAEVLNGLYEEVAGASEQNNREPFGRGGGGGNNDASSRSLEQGAVVAVGDPRTNSLIVSAARESMLQIAQLIGRLDASASKRERVYVHPLKHADVDNVAAILRGMFDEDYSNASQSQAENMLIQRTSTGASNDIGTQFGQGGGGR